MPGTGEKKENIHRITATGRGRATAFLWNDKCAAGIGRYMETFADMLNKGISEIGDIGLQCTQFPKIGDFCAVYAQSEALDFMKDEVQVEQVIAAYHDAMARRLRTLVSRFGMEKDFVVIGGLAKNPQLRARLEGILNTDILAPKTEWGPSFTTALGAAFFANSSVSRQKFAA